MISYRNLDQSSAFKKLQVLAGKAHSLTAAQIRHCDATLAAGIHYNWAARLPRNVAAEKLLPLLNELAQEQQCLEKYRALLKGEIMNRSEKRRVLHHLLRGELAGTVTEGATDLGAYYRSQMERIAAFAHKIRHGKLLTPQGQHYRHVVQIGIGGSELGPRALYRALRNWRRRAEDLEAHFISNIDVDQAWVTLQEIDTNRSLFIVVSKSGTTLETARNERYVIEHLQQAGIANPRAQMVAVTAKESPMAADERYLERFYIDNYIGGRFSSSGAVGGLLLSLTRGIEVFRELLQGAHAADQAALNNELTHNPPLLDALLGIYERNICNYPAYSLLPYSDALQDFPAHIQQLDMESNGKTVNCHGSLLSYPTGALIFGGAGTNIQHSFCQLLHQGSTIVPMIFVGFQEPQSLPQAQQQDLATHQEMQQLLNANLAAQVVAFADGESATDPNNSFAGGRPSSLLYGKQLTPSALGALLSFFENRVMFQGFLWNINSFDQPGVQLGKKLAQQLLEPRSGSSEDSAAALQSYANLLGMPKL